MGKVSIEEYLANQPFVSDKPDIEQFGDKGGIKMRFAVYLFNQDGHVFKINKSYIDELEIEDDILDWYHKGYLVFNDVNDALERGTKVATKGNPAADMLPIEGYRYRADARDFLYLIWEPDISSGLTGLKGSPINTALFTMKFIFTIYATEDVPHPSGPDAKGQKLYFHDYRYQALRERNIYYSTGKGQSAETGPFPWLQDAPGQWGFNKSSTPPGQRDNDSRSKLTGEIIQDILKKTLIGTQDFDRDWDFGSSAEFYTSPTDYKAIDDLDYILGLHVGQHPSYEPCIFKLERFTERWRLLPIGEYFARSVLDNATAGLAQGERFLIASKANPVDSQIKGTSMVPPQTVNDDPSVNYHFLDFSLISNYNFTEISGVDCQEYLTSILVHKYSKNTKTFHIDVEDNNITQVKNDFQTNFISKTYGEDFKEGQTSWLVDSSRSSNQNYRAGVSPAVNGPGSLIAGRNKILLSAFLLGNTIEFTAPGLTNRKAGKFIAINRSSGDLDNDYDRKILGQYFVTRVIHTYSRDTGYDNIITAVKPYFFRDLEFWGDRGKEGEEDVFYKGDLE